MSASSYLAAATKPASQRCSFSQNLRSDASHLLEVLRRTRLLEPQRAELREQVRYQWLLPGKTAGTGKVEGPLGVPASPAVPGTPGSAP